MKMRIQAALLPVAFLLASCSGLGEKERDTYKRGLAALDARNWTAAADFAAAVIDAKPSHGPAYLLRARAQFELGRHPEAVEDIDRAEAKGRLSEKEGLLAVLYRSRSWIEMGKKKVPETELRSDSTPVQDRREARDLFVKANAALLDALPRSPRNYDLNLWRGYSLFRLENYRKAIEVLKTCDRLDSARWEHRFFMALSWEGLYKINAQSIEAYLAIVSGGPKPELGPVYDYLTVIIPEVGAEAGRKMHAAVQAYAAAVPSHCARIDKYLAEALARQETERRALKLKSTVERVQEMVERERFREAVALIDGYLKEEGDNPELTKLLRETQEDWSQLLEVRTESLLGSGEKEKLQTALANFELARKLTGKVERLVVLQQKINVVQLGLARFETSRKIQETHDLLKKGRYQEVIQSLAGISVDKLSPHDKDLYHYLRGMAGYNLGQWTPAVKAFAAMSERNFEGLEGFHGLALVRSGQEMAGIAMLASIPPEARGDEVNRILGAHFSERDEPARAVGFLAAIKIPTPADLETHLKARRKLGKDYYEKGDYPRAVEEFQAARQILEVQLHHRALDVYLHLGNAYFRLDDFERAKKTYQDLSEADLTAAEREQCRELFFHRGQIHLREKNPDLGYKDFAEYVRLGGVIPPEFANIHARLVAIYADFAPLDKMQYWNYTSTAKDYNYTLFVKGDAKGEYRIERREAGNTSEEFWSRQGIHLTKRIGEAVVKLPLNLNPAEEALPYTEYTSQGQECTSEIVAIQQTVELPAGGRKFTDCLKVRTRRTQKAADGQVHSTKHIFYFAPGVGEVKQEVYRDDTKVSEIVLSDFAYRTAELGN